jgi:excisionase family DNA binding protein
MQAVTITQITPPELQTLIENSVKKIFENFTVLPAKPEADELLTVHQAAEFLSLSTPTLYSLISKGQVPVMKRSKRCYFLKQDLINYLKEGRKKSPAEIAAEATQYINQKKRGLK